MNSVSLIEIIVSIGRLFCIKCDKERKRTPNV